MKRKKILAALVAAGSLAVCIFCVVYIVRHHQKQLSSSSEHSGEEVIVHTGEASGEPETSDSDALKPPPEREPAEPRIVVPVDFKALQAINPETYGWITIPDTMIDYPVMQHRTDDQYYLSHTPEGDYSLNGSIFSEHIYNSATFDDPVVILYGHDVYNSAEMFSQLNNFADAEYFDAHPEMYVYAPGLIYHYAIVAAFPFSNQHIFYNRLLATEEAFDRFFSSLPETYPFDSNFREELFPSFDDRTLILSTCYRKNHKQRYLVIGVCDEVLKETAAEDKDIEETQ